MHKLPLANLSDNIQRWLFPPVCLLCGEPGADRRDLCPPCQATLSYNTFACARCALPLPQETPPGTVCGRCQSTPPAYDQAYSLFHYAPPVDRLIVRLKFSAKLNLTRLLGELLADHVADTVEVLPELIIPVPLHRSRLRERGYNQALEIARPIARRLHIPVDYRSCARLRPTSAQTSLPAKERRGNVKGAFGVVQPISARHIAIVDDVMTTGHTAQELATVLRASGVATIDIWVLARAAMGR